MLNQVRPEGRRFPVLCRMVQGNVMVLQRISLPDRVRTPGSRIRNIPPGLSSYTGSGGAFVSVGKPHVIPTIGRRPAAMRAARAGLDTDRVVVVSAREPNGPVRRHSCIPIDPAQATGAAVEIWPALQPRPVLKSIRAGGQAYRCGEG